MTRLHSPFALRALTFSMLCLSGGAAWAGGLDLPTIIASHQGTSNANGAEAADPTVLFYNPAGLTRMKPGLRVSQGGSLLNITGKVEVDPAGTRGTPQMAGEFAQNGRPLVSPNEPATSGVPGSFWPKALVAGALFSSYKVNDRVTAGFGVFAPGGGNLNYKSNWAGAYQIDSIGIETINLNPSLGFKLNDQHSFGVGVSAIVGHVNQNVQIDVPGVATYLLKSGVDTGTVDPLGTGLLGPLLGQLLGGACTQLAALTNPICAAAYGLLASSLIEPGSTGKANVEMYGFGFGFNAGYLFTLDENTRIGVAYRSESKINLKGDLTWSLDNIKASGFGAATLPLLVGYPDLKSYLENELRPNTKASSELIIPARTSVNIFHRLNDIFDVMADFTFIQTSAIQRVNVAFDDFVNKDGRVVKQGDAGINLRWKDSYKASAGININIFDDLSFRNGIQYDKTPVPSAEFRHPGAPDSDRLMLSTGFHYKVNDDLSIDGAYSYITLQDSESRYRDSCRVTNVENANGSYNPAGASCTGNGGSFSGKFKDTVIQVASIQLNLKF